MKTPEEIKKGLECCANGDRCAGHCPYDNKATDIITCTGKLSREALALIAQLEETISLMKIQMRGDCGCCAHGKNGDTALCNKCLTEKEYHPLWEYEGLPEVTGRE